MLSPFRMVCRDFILPEFCKPCLLLYTFQFAKLIVPYHRKAEHLLKQIPETDCHVFLNPKTGAPYQLHELYYLHKRILKQAGLPWVAFRNLQRQCREVGI